MKEKLTPRERYERQQAKKGTWKFIKNVWYFATCRWNKIEKASKK